MKNLSILLLTLTWTCMPSLHFDFSSPSKLAFEGLWAKTKKKAQKNGKTISSTHHLSLHNKPKHLLYHFKTPQRLRTAVDFWKMVYSKYDRNFEIFHDTENLGVVYSVLNFTKLYSNPLLNRKQRLAIFRPRLDAEEQRIKQLLLNIHKKRFRPKTLNAEEKRIYTMFKNDPNPNKFLEAADEKRIRAQTGIKNKFEAAIKTSGAFIAKYEEIFSSQGIPLEMTRLAFVESMFDLKARSKVGASGVWQFMPGTAKIYGLAINQFMDERNDPIRSAHAAARLLKNNFESLGTWPLAMNAYNSGLATMKNAVATMGTTDISTIIHGYRGGIYGFASRNFFPSFLAVLEITQEYPNHFGKLSAHPPLRYDMFLIQRPANIREFSRYTGVSLATLSGLNPHLSTGVLNGTLKIPNGVQLRIPSGSLKKFLQAEKIVFQKKPARKPKKK